MAREAEPQPVPVPDIQTNIMHREKEKQASRGKWEGGKESEYVCAYEEVLVRKGSGRK